MPENIRKYGDELPFIYAVFDQTGDFFDRADVTALSADDASFDFV